MHASGYPDAGDYDTGSQAWRDVCLARWICRLPGREEREDLLKRMKQRHGAIVVETIATLAREQWKLRREWSRGVRRHVDRATEPELFEQG